MLKGFAKGASRLPIIEEGVEGFNRKTLLIPSPSFHITVGSKRRGQMLTDQDEFLVGRLSQGLGKKSATEIRISPYHLA